jgi:hypothetical protein
MDAKNLVTAKDPDTGQIKTYNVITGEVVYVDGQLVKDHRFAYTVEDGVRITSLVREGKTLKQIASLPDFPSLHLIYAWKSIHPDFAQRLREAKADRAEHFRDKAVEVLENTVEEEDLKVAKFKFDGYTKLAAQDNPAEFGQKREEGGQAPTQIIIQTGVPLGEQPVIEVNPDGTIKES